MITILSFIFLFASVSGGDDISINFRLGIQLCDKAPYENTGRIRYTPYARGDGDGGGWSEWAGDSNYYDPDGMRIGIVRNYYDPRPPAPPFKIEDKDIRLCIQLTDHASGPDGNPKDEGEAQCTPWGSKGGGWSKFAGDSNFYDYDAVRIKLEIKKKKGLLFTNIRAGVRLTDDGTNKNKRGAKEKTEWFVQRKISTSGTSTWSEWAGDSNFYDADSIQIYLGVESDKNAGANMINWDGYNYNNNYGGHEFIILIGIICVLMVVNMACCYVYYHNNKKNKGYKAVSYDTDTSNTDTDA